MLKLNILQEISSEELIKELDNRPDIKRIMVVRYQEFEKEALQCTQN
jgi:hypothetical protein